MSIQSLDQIAARRNGPFILQRLTWIDDKLRWHGEFARSDVMRRFGVSPQQASADIAMYRQLAAGNVRLETATRNYVRGEAYAPVFPKDAFRWMNEGKERADASVIPFEALTQPSRRIDEDVMARVTVSFASRQALAISYQSLTTPEITDRIICPHQVVDTGDRVHVRAWDDRRRLFADFVVGRVLRAELEPNYPWVDGIADAAWNETIELVLAADRRLSPSQKRTIEREFHMQSGRLSVPVRQALVVYVLGRLGLLEAVRAGREDAKVSRGIRCINHDDIRPILPRVTVEADEVERL